MKSNDPIFALIDADRKAEKVCIMASNAATQALTRARNADRKNEPANAERLTEWFAVLEKKFPYLREAKERDDAAIKASKATFNVVSHCKPTTAAGLVALLKWSLRFCELADDNRGVKTAIDGLEKFAKAA